MQSDPVEEWQRLTALYGKMGDIELRELASGIGDLTETAQQALRDELKRRGIPEQPPLALLRDKMFVQSRTPDRRTVSHFAPESPEDEDSGANEEVDADGNVNQKYEYTWKTPLCECDGIQQARQICSILLREGIESWIEGPGSENRFDLPYPRVIVAADQLEQARSFASELVPENVADALASETGQKDEPSFVSPICPECGAPDPILEAVDPSNSWHCESCGNDWADPIADSGAGPDPRLV